MLTRSRDAWPAIRGYVYQVDLTIERWLHLEDDEVLELERGEDIDLISRALGTAPDEQGRLLEQVKHRQRAVTLRSPSAQAALANAFIHQTANPGLKLVFRYATNARPGRERGVAFSDGEAGITEWERLRRGEVLDGRKPATLAVLRGLLRSSRTPKGIERLAWRDFQAFIAHSTDEELADFIRRFEWATGVPESAVLEAEIRRKLVEGGYAPDDETAAQLHDRLLVHVFRLLSEPGLKRLTAAERAAQLTKGTLTPEDRRLLDQIASVIGAIGRRVDALEESVQTQGEALARVDVQVEEITRVVGPYPRTVDHGWNPINAALESHITDLSRILSADVREQVERMRRTWREGRKQEVLEWLQRFEGDLKRRSALDPGAVAAVLRFNAGLLLEERREYSRVKELLDQARGQDPGGSDVRLRALLTLREDGIDRALAELGDASDNPTRVFRAGLLLDAMRPAEALAELAAVNTSEPLDAEAFRVCAAAAFLAGDLPKAREAVERALVLQPLWFHIRLLAVHIEYFGGLSPAAYDSASLGWPHPIDLDLVRQDEEGNASLESALRRLDDLLLANGDDTERTVLQGWRLACLANLTGRREEAIEYCRALLDANPGNTVAALWSNALQFGIDIGPTITALEERLSSAPWALDALALGSCYLASGRGHDLAPLLKRTKSLFEAGDAEATWRHWWVKALLAEGKLNAASAFVDALPEQSAIPLRTLLALARADKSGEYGPLANDLCALYERTGNPRYLLDACQLHKQLGTWKYVANHSAALVEKVNTFEAVRLAATALYMEDRHVACLALLDECILRYPAHAVRLRRIRVEALEALGRIGEAIADAEFIASADPRIQTLLSLAQLHLFKGDLRRVAQLAAEVRNRPDLPVTSAIGFAQVLVHEDLELARELWRIAARREIPDDVVTSALFTAYQLGLDAETRPLLERMTILAREGRGGAQSVSVDRVVEFQSQRMDAGASLLESYARGETAIHQVSDFSRQTLASFFLVHPTQNEADPNPLRQFAMMIRHGGRGVAAEPQEEPVRWRICLDLTALLLAEHLEILPDVERVFPPLLLPHGIMRALMQMRDSLMPHQPSRLETDRALVAAEAERRLAVRTEPLPEALSEEGGLESQGRTWIGLLRLAAERDGYVLDFRSAAHNGMRPVSEIAEEFLARLVSPMAVLESLLQQGPLTVTEYETARRALGSEGEEDFEGAIPAQRRPLFCYQNAVDLLVDAGLLAPVCERFQVYVEPEDHAGWLDTIRTYENQKRFSDRVDALRRRISDGLGAHSPRYLLLPRRAIRDESERRLNAGSALGILAEVIGTAAGSAEVVWVEDRYVNSHVLAGSIRIVDVTDVLAALRAHGQIGEQREYQVLHRLRAGNFRFVPPGAPEILHHLRGAVVRDDCVVETRPLAVLRRYVAGCLLRADMLQVPRSPVSDPSELREFPFLLALHRAAAEAMVDLWDTETVEAEELAVRAEWLLSSLYVDFGLMRSAAFERSHALERDFAARGLSGLLSGALSLLDPVIGGDHPRARRYLEWLEGRLLESRFLADPALVPEVADLLKGSLTHLLEHGALDASFAEARAMAGALLDLLPAPLRKEIEHDREFLARLGRRIVTRFTVDGLSFEMADFVSAAVTAMGGECAGAREMDREREFVFEPAPPPALFQLRDPVDGLVYPIMAPLLRLLAGSPSEWEELLRRHRALLDASVAEAKRIANEVERLAPGERIQRMMELADDSLAGFYAQLKAIIGERQAFAFVDLLPSNGASVLRHLRLDDAHLDEPFLEIWASAATVLLREERPSEALLRLGGIPVSLPPTVLESARSLAPEEVRAQIRHRLQQPASPIMRFHELRILVHLGWHDPVYARLARRLARSLFTDEWRADVRTFLVLLKYVDTQLGLRPEMRDLPVAAPLAVIWYHTHRIFELLTAGHVDMSRFAAALERQPVRVGIDLFERMVDHWRDSAYHRNVSPLAFTIAGLAYALGEHGSALLDERTRGFIRSLCFAEMGGVVIPTPTMLHDRTLLRNALAGFLNPDPTVAYVEILGWEGANRLGSQNLHALAADWIQVIEENPDQPSPWGMLLGIVQDEPLYPDLTGRMQEIVVRTDFVDLLRTDPLHGLIPLQVAAWQAAHAGNAAARDGMKSSLRAVAEYLHKRGSVGSEQENGITAEVTILECAATLAAAEGGISDAITDFATQVEQLLEINPGLETQLRTLVQRFGEELPLEYAAQLTRLLLVVRALATNSAPTC